MSHATSFLQRSPRARPALDPAKAQSWMRTGAWFQMPMLGLFALSPLLFPFYTKVMSVSTLIDTLGGALFLWCLVAIYVRPAQGSGLIVSGPFRFTRNPMYIGLLLMDSANFLPHPASSSAVFIVIQLAFLGCLIAASYCQEQETLARFGQDAEDYYANTPRIPFTPW